MILHRAAALVVLVLLSACGTEQGQSIDAKQAPPVDRPNEVPTPPGDVTIRYPVTVLDDGDGAELCLGGVQESLPPQCGGPPLVGWDWSDHDAGDFESSSGVRWGDFVITGEFDGTKLTPREIVPASQFETPPHPDEEPQFDTPCPEPEGGWVVDPARTGFDDFNRVMAAAAKLSGHADSWVDQSRDPRSAEQTDEDLTEGHEHTSSWIANVRVTGNPAAAEAELRDLWGGGLCVIRAEHTMKELRAVQDEVNELPGMLYSAPSDQRVELGVVYDDGSIQAWVDQEFGVGIVVVGSALVDAD